MAGKAWCNLFVRASQIRLVLYQRVAAKSGFERLLASDSFCTPRGENLNDCWLLILFVSEGCHEGGI